MDRPTSGAPERKNPRLAGGFVWPLVYSFVFALALLLRIGYANRFPAEAVVEAVDAQGYQQIALNLLAGHGFSLQAAPPFRPDAVRTPLYPAFVALVYAVTGPRPATVALVQAVLDSLTALVTGALAARLAGPRAGLLAALAYALMPGQWRFANALLTETMLAFLITLATWALVRFVQERRTRDAAVCGALLGLAVLCKPNVVMLPALYAFAAGVAALSAFHRGGAEDAENSNKNPLRPPRLRGEKITHPPGTRAFREGLRTTGIVLGTTALVVLPWAVRNQLAFGHLFVSTAFQDNLARVTAPATLAEAQGESVAPWTPRWEALYGGVVAQAAQRYAWPPGDVEQLDTATYEARQAQIAAVAWEIVQAHPQAALASHLKGFVRSWVPTTEGEFWYEVLSGRPWASTGAAPDAVGEALALARNGQPGAAWALLVEQRWQRLPALARILWYGWALAYLAGGLLAVAGAWALRRQPALAAVLVLTILIVTLLPGPIAYIRFRVPVVGLIVALEAVGLARLQEIHLASA